MNRTFEIIGSPFGKIAFSFGFRKESSIFNLISNKILTLKNDGSIEKMLTDWFLDWKCDTGQIFQVILVSLLLSSLNLIFLCSSKLKNMV
jgi:hypothetical protein